MLPGPAATSAGQGRATLSLKPRSQPYEKSTVHLSASVPDQTSKNRKQTGKYLTRLQLGVGHLLPLPPRARQEVGARAALGLFVRMA